jgi:hypothetical protein
VRRMLLSTLAAGLLLGIANSCPAQANLKPLLTVSFSGYDKLLADVGAIGQLVGNPDMAAMVEMPLKFMTQGKGLAGLDTKQPWGLAVLTDGKPPFVVLGFLPVTDLKQLMDVAKGTALGENLKVNDDVYEIQTRNGPSIYVKQKGKWAVATDRTENLAKAPDDPLTLLGDLPQRYDLAARLLVQNTPKEYRDQAMAGLRAMAEIGMPQMAGESDDDYKLRANATRQSVEALAAAADELDSLLVGWSLDPSAKTMHLDFEMTAQTGTKLAERVGQIKPGNTRFAGLQMPNAAINANWTRTLADVEVAETKDWLATARKTLLKELQKRGLGEADQKMSSQLLGDVFDVLQATVETKKTDVGLAVLLSPSEATLVAGGGVADGGKLETALKRLVDKIQQEDAKTAKSIKLNAETYEGVRFHILSLPAPERLAPMVGKTADVVLGIADDKLFVAAGRDAAKTLKKVLDESKAAGGKEVLPFQVSVAATSVTKFIAQASPDDEVAGNAAQLAELLAMAGGKDHITVTAQPVPQGVRVRLDLEEGLLKAMVAGSPLGPMMMGPGGAAPVVIPQRR